ncbi:hypothetical protein TNCV_209941 [Trichonephila clavipes]|uniref:Uncharacterized protein n=1 Tax=Trichonephila clavipes TaxID=2585209 RepID=A0A8X6VIV2_TRICX|nr:hypothetical protein TNCV_209941 [Trichonephila clavipes]
MQINVHDVKNEKKCRDFLKAVFFRCFSGEIQILAVVVRKAVYEMSWQRHLSKSMTWSLRKKTKNAVDAVRVIRRVIARLWNRFQETRHVGRQSGQG